MVLNYNWFQMIGKRISFKIWLEAISYLFLTYFSLKLLLKFMFWMQKYLILKTKYYWNVFLGKNIEEKLKEHFYCVCYCCILDRIYIKTCFLTNKKLKKSPEITKTLLPFEMQFFFNIIHVHPFTNVFTYQCFDFHFLKFWYSS